MSINIGNNFPFINQSQQTAKPKENGRDTASFADALSKSQQASGSSASADRNEKYDFKNMTPRTMRETMNSLIRNGEMTFEESTPLMAMIPSPLSKVNYDGNMPASFDQSWDFLAKIQDGIRGALSRNEKASADTMQQTYDALMRLQGGKKT
ncbi:hypothetical protein [Janthinobacterium agaricidamnosum]|uniref:hypothetical protein n=1 Tax=Janthinobacterium agaricidamnosum TaxID=55508 RepID=UPI0005701745|nr:hypothetical protein [Janthinobacterium agaricidamnosum]